MKTISGYCKLIFVFYSSVSPHKKNLRNNGFIRTIMTEQAANSRSSLNEVYFSTQ